MAEDIITCHTKYKSYKIRHSRLMFRLIDLLLCTVRIWLTERCNPLYQNTSKDWVVDPDFTLHTEFIFDKYPNKNILRSTAIYLILSSQTPFPNSLSDIRPPDSLCRHWTAYPAIQSVFPYLILSFLILPSTLHNTAGKTIQAIAMILDNRPDPKDKVQKAIWDLSDIRHDVDPKVSDLCYSCLILD